MPFRARSIASWTRPPWSSASAALMYARITVSGSPCVLGGAQRLAAGRDRRVGPALHRDHARGQRRRLDARARRARGRSRSPRRSAPAPRARGRSEAATAHGTPAPGRARACGSGGVSATARAETGSASDAAAGVPQQASPAARAARPAPARVRRARRRAGRARSRASASPAALAASAARAASSTRSRPSRAPRRRALPQLQGALELPQRLWMRVDALGLAAGPHRSDATRGRARRPRASGGRARRRTPRHRARGRPPARAASVGVQRLAARPATAPRMPPRAAARAGTRIASSASGRSPARPSAARTAADSSGARDRDRPRQQSVVHAPPGSRQHPHDALGVWRQPLELHRHRVAQRVGKLALVRRVASSSSVKNGFPSERSYSRSRLVGAGQPCRGSATTWSANSAREKGSRSTCSTRASRRELHQIRAQRMRPIAGRPCDT